MWSRFRRRFWCARRDPTASRPERRQMSRTLPRLAALLLTVASAAHVTAAPVAAEELVGSTTRLTLAANDPRQTLLPLFPATRQSTASSETAAGAMAPDFSRIRRPRLL